MNIGKLTANTSRILPSIVFQTNFLVTFVVIQLQSPWPGGGGLEDIRSAIKQLTLRSRDSSSTATSASSAGGGSNNGAQGMLMFCLQSAKLLICVSYIL